MIPVAATAANLNTAQGAVNTAPGFTPPAAVVWDDTFEVGSEGVVMGIDLGGTNCEFSAVSPEMDIVRRVTLPVPKGEARSPEGVLALLREGMRECEKELGVAPRAVGIGVPGAVDYERGLVDAPDFPLWRGATMLEMLGDGFGVPAVVDNDANFYALGEAHSGAGVGIDKVLTLTLGTGVGGGIVRGGKVSHGDAGLAGEVGHVIVERNGVECGCGARGCLERYAASKSFVLHASRLFYWQREQLVEAAGVGIDKLTPDIVASLAREGNSIANELWATYGSYLGMGIASMVSMLGITTVVLGGGIAQSLDLFEASTMSSLAKYLRPSTLERVRLIKGQLGSEAGTLGAASAAWSAVRG